MDAAAVATENEVWTTAQQFMDEGSTSLWCRAVVCYDDALPIFAGCTLESGADSPLKACQ